MKHETTNNLISAWGALIVSVLCDSLGFSIAFGILSTLHFVAYLIQLNKE